MNVMFKRLYLWLTGCTMLLVSSVFADETEGPSLVLLTENFPPYNMAKNGKNFAQNQNLEGIAVDILRETFKRADVGYSMTCASLGSVSTTWPSITPTMVFS